MKEDEEEMLRLPKETRIEYSKKFYKALTVKELIEKLQAFDGDKPVMIYEGASEEGGLVRDVTFQTLENAHYFKGDHPFYFLDMDEAVCIESN